MGPIPGAGYGGRKQQQRKGKTSRSGNPAKRAAENAALAAGVKPVGGIGGGSGFGLGGQQAPGQQASGQQAPTGEELAAVQRLFGRG
jgi:signal recognition particle subunit SRP54